MNLFWLFILNYNSDQLQLTVEDKDRYEKRISKIDLNDITMVLKEVP